MKSCKEALAAHIEFLRAVSIIADTVTSARESDLQKMRVLLNDLLILTLNCINEKRAAHD